MVFSKGWYDKLKFLAQIVLPALGTLYATVSGLMKWPNTEEVVGVIMAVDFFLGTLLSVSTKFYEKDPITDGAFVVTETPEGKKVTLDLQDSPDALATKDVITFKNNVRDQVVEE